MLTTVCYRLNNKSTYGIEGSIFIAGAGIQWLRDKLKIINKAEQTEKISNDLKHNNDIYFVPAFTGLGAPYWEPHARGVLIGLNSDTGRNEIIRATLESVAYQTSDLLHAMNKDGIKPKILKIDGGMVKNNWFSQFLSSVINLNVLRPKVQETTALGAALLAGYSIGVFKKLSDISRIWKIDKKFKPNMSRKNRLKLLNGWNHAIKKTIT